MLTDEDNRDISISMLNETTPPDLLLIKAFNHLHGVVHHKDQGVESMFYNDDLTQSSNSDGLGADGTISPKKIATLKSDHAIVIKATVACEKEDYSTGTRDVNEKNMKGEMETAVGRASDTLISATFDVSVLGDASILEIDRPSPSERLSELSLSSAIKSASIDSKTSFSPIVDLLKKDYDRSPIVNKDRKYNLNDSDISFLMNENRVYDMALRDVTDPTEMIEQLNRNIIVLEGEKAEALEKLLSLSDEFEKYKTKFLMQDAELLDVNRKLTELTRSKENAEKTVADYEFIVEDLKKRHIKQKEDLHAKMLALEEAWNKRLDAAVSGFRYPSRIDHRQNDVLTPRHLMHRKTQI
ncbi:hypothetical protein DICVIV_06428 [Dictyocaulus viviparus]|uniref:Uncharacterized protein n=1 Tax=Dictyocaulus viviparus TaxID=29172 RepID=A0A0D8XSH8_DICVI|nr:hypothetical protein DICVIV_06428 [Dictyocaulus viviparus]